ncbi:MAG: methyltransferase [Gemmatimonadota bacterium]
MLTALIVLIAPAHTLLTSATPADLLDPSPSVRFILPWALMLLGVGVRLWGSGNLRKNQEITASGVYILVRHPLYVGSLALFLAYFLTVGEPWLGCLLFAFLVGLVYYPTMLSEEEYLTFKFPKQFAGYDPPPRLLPDPRRLGEALRTDRFETRSAYRNLGFRSAWFLLGLPLFLRALSWLESVVA